MVQPGDLVLVYIEGNPAFFARVEMIRPDLKPQWYQVKLLILQVPLVVATWILRRAYIDGDEFTMGGRPVRMVKVVSPEEIEEAVESKSEKITAIQEPTATPEASSEATKSKRRGKVVSLADRRKRDQPS
jgi:hypothetical protein